MDTFKIKVITASCPHCDAKPKDIRYYNAGPSVWIQCQKCSFVVHERTAWDAGFKHVIDYWNSDKERLDV